MNLNYRIILGDCRDLSDLSDLNKKSVHLIITSPPYWCFDGNTLIITKNNGIKPIKEMNVNELVFTHNARWKRVTEIKKHNIKEDVVSIKVSGSTDRIISTNEHPFYALKPDKCLYDKKCKRS